MYYCVSLIQYWEIVTVPGFVCFVYLFVQVCSLGFIIFLFFVYYNHHNRDASTSITAETHTHGAWYKGSPRTPDQIERHSRNGSWTWNQSCL